MSDYGHGFEPRFKLEEAKFFFNQMDLSLQDHKDKRSLTRFHYYLDAFLYAARNVTWVFQREFRDNKKLIQWYDKKRQKWKKDNIMKLFVRMRNISSKEHTPETLTLSASKARFDPSRAVIERSVDDNIQIEIPVHKSDEKSARNQNQLRSAVTYFFRVPRWFDGNPDVIILCKYYLARLEEFVAEAEGMIPGGKED